MNHWVECLLNDKRMDGCKLKEMCAMVAVLHLIPSCIPFLICIEAGGAWLGSFQAQRLTELKIMGVCI